MKNIIIVITLSILFSCISIYSVEFKIHYLKDGETLWRVSKNYKIPLDDLCNFNNIDDVTKVKKGAKIKIPINKTKNLDTNDKETSIKIERKYFDYNLPLKGNIIPFVTSHFRGIIIFSEDLQNNVISVKDGCISYVGDVSGYGLTVIIKHDDGFITSYSGFKEVFIKKDNKVAKGEKLGIAGNLSRYKKNGILFSIQYNETGLKFDMEKQKFYK